MSRNTIKRVFGSIRSIINLTIKENGLEGHNGFSGTYHRMLFNPVSASQFL
jgi:hypothetical protein